MSMLVTSLFVSAFLSATLLPGSSEVMLAGILAAGKTSTVLAIVAATAGNTLGSCVNWGLGRFFAHWRGRTWFPVPEERFGRYSDWYNRWGLWSLLLSWMPVIGAPLTVLAGVARTPLPVFVIIVLVAKAARYLGVAGVVQAVV
jgi:membrane protein YqaA with SNARE-associated domain